MATALVLVGSRVPEHWKVVVLRSTDYERGSSQSRFVHTVRENVQLLTRKFRERRLVDLEVLGNDREGRVREPIRELGQCISHAYIDAVA